MIDLLQPRLQGVLPSPAPRRVVRGPSCRIESGRPAWTNRNLPEPSRRAGGRRAGDTSQPILLGDKTRSPASPPWAPRSPATTHPLGAPRTLVQQLSKADASVRMMSPPSRGTARKLAIRPRPHGQLEPRLADGRPMASWLRRGARESSIHYAFPWFPLLCPQLAKPQERRPAPAESRIGSPAEQPSVERGGVAYPARRSPRSVV